VADLRGGKREGAGRKPSGKSKVQYWVTPEEAEFLRLKLQEKRNEIHSEPVEELVIKICPKCGKKLKLRHRKSDNKPFLGCGGFPNCTYLEEIL